MNEKVSVSETTGAYTSVVKTLIILVQARIQKIFPGGGVQP